MVVYYLYILVDNLKVRVHPIMITRVTRSPFVNKAVGLILDSFQISGHTLFRIIVRIIDKGYDNWKEIILV